MGLKLGSGERFWVSFEATETSLDKSHFLVPTF